MNSFNSGITCQFYIVFHDNFADEVNVLASHGRNCVTLKFAIGSDSNGVPIGSQMPCGTEHKHDPK